MELLYHYIFVANIGGFHKWVNIMGDMTLIPTGGNVGADAGAAGIGGLIGAGLGSMLGNGGWGNGWGGHGGVGTSTVQASVDTNAILTGINDLATQTGNLGMTLVQGQNNLGVSILQGQNSTNTTVERAASSTYTGLTAQNTQALLSTANGFATVGSAIMQSGNATQAAIASADRGALERSFQAQLEAQRCCCETNLNIERQAEATRALMRDQFATSQAVLICDLKSQIQNRDILLSQAAQTAQLNCKINQVEQLVNFKLPTPPTPPTGCC